MSWYLSISEDEFDIIYKGLPVNKELFRSTPKSDEDFVANYLPSKLWRLNNLYTIVDKDGNKTAFLMNYSQHRVYAASLRHPRIIILKSRQQGISTLWLIAFYDDAKFIDNLSIGMLAQGLEEAATLLERVKVAEDNFSPAINEFLGISIVQDNTKAIGWSNGSTIFIRTSFRSATLQRLHVSEMGKIAAKDPMKVKELKTGTLQTIKAGNPAVIESTAEGSNNEFYVMWTVAYDFVGTRGPKDFFPVFLSWLDDPDCTLSVPQHIDSEAQEYFEGLEAETGHVLTKEQKWFWVAQRRELGLDVYQEYPGTPEEAFASVRDGTYYARDFRRLNHIVANLYDSNLDVEVAVDLGMNDTMVLIFFQRYREELRIVDEYHNNGEAISHYVNIMKDKPYPISEVWLPHDAKVRSMESRKTRLQIFREHGVKARLVRRTRSVMNDIEVVRKTLPYIWVDVTLNYVRDTFKNYTKEWDAKLGVWKDRPKHDEWSNPADAIRMMVMSRGGYTTNTRIHDKHKKSRRQESGDGYDV
jgi:hypothetical protein